MEAGQIYFDQEFYCDLDTGVLKGKYFLVLAVDPAGDVVSRLLTSRQNGRPKAPPCYHGLPYPGFYLGIIGGPLNRESWIDLRELEDFERSSLDNRIRSGKARLITQLPRPLLGDALNCIAAADDTTLRQERLIRDQLSLLR